MNASRIDRRLESGLQAPGNPAERRVILTIPALAFFVFASLLASLSGCVPVPRGDDFLDVRFMTTDELRDYSQRVFRHQNSVTTRLMMAPSLDTDLSKSERRRIDKAESRMNAACASLNEVAAARARGIEGDMALRNEVRKTVRACARSARRLEELLDVHGIGSEFFNSS